MSDKEPPIIPPKKPFDLEEAKRRDANSPWKKNWEGNGTPEPVIPYEEWKRRKANGE